MDIAGRLWITLVSVWNGVVAAVIADLAFYVCGSAHLDLLESSVVAPGEVYVPGQGGQYRLARIEHQHESIVPVSTYQCQLLEFVAHHNLPWTLGLDWACESKANMPGE